MLGGAQEVRAVLSAPKIASQISLANIRVLIFDMGHTYGYNASEAVIILNAIILYS